MSFMLFMKKSSALLALLRRSLQEPRLVLAHYVIVLLSLNGCFWVSLKESRCSV